MAYKTEIQIGVKGTAQLDKLRQQITSLNNKVNQIDEAFGRGVQSVKRYEENLRKAADTLRKAKMATDDEERAVKQYVTALNNANAAQQRQNSLIEKEITRRGQATQALRKYNAELAGPRQPGGSMAGSYLRPQQARGTTQYQFPIGPQADVAGAFMKRTEAAAQAAKRLTAEFIVNQRAARQLAEEQRRINSAEFITRTDAAAKAANRQNAEFIRQQRIAKQIAADLAKAPAPQLLLAPGAPGGPAMSGGARSLITGPVERLGGARTEDEAQRALRFAQALEEQIRPLSQIGAIFAGITGEANRLSKVKALPSSEMLDAAARGLQRLENAEERRNRELKESAERLKEVDRLEASRARRAKKLQDRAKYFAEREGGGADAPKRRTRLEQFADFGLGAGFPLLFGGGAGQVLGGALGTAIGGGGPAGFGLQIAFSAIGGQIEEAIARTAELGRALESLDLSALADSTLLVNAELRETVQNSIDLGESQKAVEAIAKATLLQTGLFPENISDATNAATLLSNVWDELVGSVSGLVSIVATPLVSALTAVLSLVNVIVKGFNTVVGLVGLGIKRIVEFIGKLPIVNKLLKFIEENTRGTNEAAEARTATLLQTGKQLEKELGLEQQVFALEKQRAAGTDAAAKLKNAQIKRDIDLTKLEAETRQKIIDKNREFAGAQLEDQRKKQVGLIQELAAIERQRILNNFSLDEQAAGQLKLKEIEKARKETAKEALEIRRQEVKIGESRIQTQLNELTNEEKIFQIRQQTAAASIQLDRVRAEAQLSLLRLQESRLQRELDSLQKLNTNFERQRELIDKIAANRAKQAKVENQVAKAQAQQGIRQAIIAQQQVKFQVQRIKLELQLQKIKAQGEKDDNVRLQQLQEINNTQAQNNQLIEVMVNESNKQVDIARKIAVQQGKIADNLLKGKLESIEAERVEARRAANAKELAKATGQAADEAARLARNSSSGAGRTTTSAASTSMKIDPDVYQSVIDNAPAFGYRNTYELAAALDKAQQVKNAQTAKAAQMSQPSATSYSSTYNTGTALAATPLTPTVNVSTGPVMQVDNKRYVSMEDFESGLRQVSSINAAYGRSYAGRRYGGVV